MLTELLEMPSFFASSACVIPALLRSADSLSLKPDIAITSPLP